MPSLKWPLTFESGFVSGQAAAYCEQVRNGGKLAAQINCDSTYAELVEALAAEEGCRCVIEFLAPGRVSLWLYRHEFVAGLISHFQSTAPSEAGIWSMGKLFGYSDDQIARFIQDTSLTQARSTSESIPTRLRDGGTAYSNKGP